MAASGFARIYVEAGAAAQALNATPGTFNKVTAFAADGASYGGALPANANDNITMPPGSPSMPLIASFNASFVVGTAGLYRFALYVDGVLVPGSERRITCALTTVYTVGGIALIAPAENAASVVELRAASDQVSPNLTVSYGALEARQ